MMNKEILSNPKNAIKPVKHINKEEKNMMNTTNTTATTTNTTATTATKKPVLTKKGQAIHDKTKADTKSKTKADTKSKTKAVSAEEKAKKTKTPYYTAPVKSEDGRGKITVWKSTWNNDGVSKGAELKAVSMPVPRNIIPGMEADFAKAVQFQLYRYQIAVCREQIAKLNKITAPENDKRRELTEKEKARKEAFEGQKDLAEKKAKAISLPAEVKNNAFANTCSRFLLNAPIMVECSSVISALCQASKVLTGELTAITKDGKTEVTPEGQKVLTDCKDAIRKALSPLTEATELTCEFKLSIGNKDLIDFYRLGFDGWNSKLDEIDLYSKESSKKLEVQLVRFFLRKVKIADAETLIQ